MREPREHARDRNLVEDVLRRVPGFRGYLEKEYRRESDELARMWMADRLQRAKRALDEAARPLLDAGQIDLVPAIDRVRGRLDKIIWQLRSAMQGYSGFFDLVRVDEALLERVYAHDVALFADVENLAELIESLPSKKDPIADVLPDVLNRIDDIEAQLNHRTDMLKGVE
ncbi:MAG: hypothetical protein JW809_17400 [Pirellulales bacterium]|nr:hypothetical protein [Pirellulales bacterium]